MTECLIVDDSRVIRTIARRILQDLRFDVREAADGAEALKACLERMPDAVLLDWNMPVMTGIDFLKALRLVPNGTTPVVVFCRPKTTWHESRKRSRSAPTNTS